jgi:hypothetical protein
VRTLRTYDFPVNSNKIYWGLVNAKRRMGTGRCGISAWTAARNFNRLSAGIGANDLRLLHELLLRSQFVRKVEEQVTCHW